MSLYKIDPDHSHHLLYHPHTSARGHSPWWNFPQRFLRPGLRAKMEFLHLLTFEEGICCNGKERQLKHKLAEQEGLEPHRVVLEQRVFELLNIPLLQVSQLGKDEGHGEHSQLAGRASAAPALRTCLSLPSPWAADSTHSWLQRCSLDGHLIKTHRLSQVALVVKNPPANAGDVRHGFNPWVRKIPWVGNGNILQFSCLENATEEPGGLYSPWGRTVGHDRCNLAAAAHTHTHTQALPQVLPSPSSFSQLFQAPCAAQNLSVITHLW